MKLAGLFLLIAGASSRRYYDHDVEESETTIPVGPSSHFANYYGGPSSNFIDSYGGRSFIGGNRGIGFGHGNLGLQQGFGYQRGFDGHHQSLENPSFHGGYFNGLGHGGYHRGGFPISSFGGGFAGHHPYGGELVDQSTYNSGKKNLADGSYEKSSGNKIAELSQGENGYTQGKVGQRNSKGDLGYFNDQQAAKNLQEDGKIFNAGQRFNQEGQNANENKQQLGHKKGHVIKGFKSSHHKDETGKTEEFYDEAHDEGDNFKVEGQAGKFGEDSQLSLKGGHDDSFYNVDERKKQGHYDGQQYVNKNNADQGQYGQNKYLGNGQIFGVNNGVDQQSLLGHQQHSRFFKHHPYQSHFYR